jgi:hypothetical protein
VVAGGLRWTLTTTVTSRSNDLARLSDHSEL